MQTSSFQVLGLSLTSPSRGENRLILKLENRDVVDRVCTVHVQTGALWFRGFGKGTRVEILPQDTVECSIPYEWQASSGGVLTVTVFEHGPGDVPNCSQPLFRMRYEQPVNHADLRGPAGCRFVHQAKGRIRAWAQEGGYASRHLDELVDERLRALEQIAKLLGASPPTIDLVFYETHEGKTTDTGHRGMGKASGTTIVEVCTESSRVDPYHELVHIIAGQVGNPPALFSEGLAVYISELLGANALDGLLDPDALKVSGGRIDEAVKYLRRKGELWPMSMLFSFAEIGSEASRPNVSYAQAASFVKYLWETRGKTAFLEAYAGLETPCDPAAIERNEREFERIFGLKLAEAEAEWLSGVGR